MPGSILGNLNAMECQWSILGNLNARQEAYLYSFLYYISSPMYYISRPPHIVYQYFYLYFQIIVVNTVAMFLRCLRSFHQCLHMTLVSIGSVLWSGYTVSYTIQIFIISLYNSPNSEVAQLCISQKVYYGYGDTWLPQFLSYLPTP